ncbi:YmiA family putative membrane protein [Chimaeribacter californicus]|uniref:YmiA family putative membrane protein n=1 Tax=Chimaeribacter californicus TaxID=2060067 RepID=A0A2N5EGJ2_9GAMM|nr:YmiA family putative membrane protein [Chimaeribacter californicus]PLR41663.1 YmiA family putative membrane protein [Chimaeribacter californicus]
MRSQKQRAEDNRLRRKVWLAMLAGCGLFWGCLLWWLFG